MMEYQPGGDRSGTVVTIGAGGKPVPSDGAAVEFARQVASEPGTTIVVTDVTKGEGADQDGRPIVINPPSLPSNS